MNTYRSEKVAYIITFALAGLYSSWWLINFFFGQPGDLSHEIYSDTYWIVALVGVLYGYSVAKLWGGHKSILGKALILFTLGLLGQVVGQIIYSYFALVKHIDAPYPSLGDVGFFGSVLLYIVAVLMLSKALGIHFRSGGKTQRVISIAAPLALLVGSYAIFLRDYQFDGSWLVTFFDFGYPLGQAVYISLALFMFVLSARLLGGKMKNKILLLLLALSVQYIADFTFLYRFSKDLWYAGGVNDLTYQIAYLLMTIALLQIGSVSRKLQSKQSE